MACRLFVAHEHETELRVLVNGVVHGQNGAARNTEHDFDTPGLPASDQRPCAGHLLAVDNGALVRMLVGVRFGHAAERLQGVGDTVPSFVRCLVFKASAAGAIRVPRRALR